MNGPWSNAAAAWTAVAAAWGKLGGQAAEATVGRPAIALAATGGAGAARADNGGENLALRMETRPAGTLAAAQAPVSSAAPGVAGRPAAATGLAELIAARTDLDMAGREAKTFAASTALARPAVLAAAPRACLAGTGIREVLRLLSPPTTATRLASPLSTRLGLSCAIDIEQT
ncbi:hypothetical protein [Solidesulfovibrio magneticus]|uniref:Uncharacterized protein n=1 Tax=Solidesulfovibrio magneticus (strain ATCC 700980 / DSM 13731 / RS-1) TaxID=573370 RepID=C4XHD4_SOLM1|nr:hypothetical protein [Solidesulfovibrio magneticus]BAH73902.1 hypothetical protein DMR_04110 [Solidesulfovibrio magneticus RS-1]